MDHPINSQELVATATRASEAPRIYDSKFMESSNYSKLIGCSIHGAIRVEPMALKIINTPEFQRMRFIKQLGLCYQVYPAATHTRFEHSIGVYHLAGRVLEKIRQKYPKKEYFIPELGKQRKLTDKIVECIKIAGLCHDIGHGPFSHIFDDILLRDMKHPNKEHEVRSCLIVELLCERELGLKKKYINLIKSVISPQKHNTGVLYQIVANQLNGIDVDKFDYLIRDAKHLGLQIGFDPNRLINEFIIDADNNIAYPKHCSVNVFEMFYGRYMMHKKVYSHKTVKLIESMLSDLFIKVDPIFKISESVKDMKKFCELVDDTISHYIDIIIEPPKFLKAELTESEHKAIKDAYDIYHRIHCRNLYQQVVELPEDAEIYFEEFLTDFTKIHPEITRNDFDISKTKVGFVSGNKPDPFENIYFYDKKENNSSFRLDKSYISSLINNNIQETHTHLICKKRDLTATVLAAYKNFALQKIKK